MKRYERPVVIASYTAAELREEAALVVANSYRDGGSDNNWWNHQGPR